MSARRCSTCGVNYPSSVISCRVCGQTTWFVSGDDPDTDWEQSSPKAEESEPVECASRDDFFDKWGADGDAAFAILAECEFPPSLEVFEHGLESARDRAKAPIAIQRYARTLADAHQRAK